jgi:DNA-binding CsgD family transcriptional regulator/predicted negative regulator of RcsB-dependent stress response
MVRPTPKSVICPVLIGRSAIIDSLDQMIDQVEEKSRSSHVALLSGEAGVGKSRLVTEMRAHAVQQGWSVLQGQCFENDRALPYAPLLDLLRNFCAACSVEEIAEAFGPVAPEIIKLLPELRALIPGITPTPLLEPEAEKRRLFHALSQFYINLIRRQACLVVIEDLHWSDDTSFEFLNYLARRLATQPARSLLLLTYRSDEASPALMHFLAELDRERLAAEYKLPRLTPSEVDEMLRTIFDQARPVRSEFLNAIFALTEGNPFFIEEILRSLMEAGEIFYVEAQGFWDRKPMRELHIPRSVQDAVHHRTERLSQAARQILTMAAVTGQRFDFALLQQLTRSAGFDQQEFDEKEILSVIKELISAQLVVEESADRFAFRHWLTRQAVYAQLLVRERKAIHQQVAQIMESMYTDPARLEAHLGDLANHFFEAGVWEKALEYSQRAGEKAQSLYAPRQAVEHFTRAIDAAHKTGLGPSLSLYLARGQAYKDLDDFEQARADYQAALELAQAIGDHQMEWQATLDLGALWSGHDYIRGGDYFQLALEIARTLDDPSTLAYTQNRVGNWHLNSGRPIEARRHHDEALKIFEAIHDKRGIAQTLDLMGIAHYIAGDLVRGTACYEQSLSLFRELNDRQGMINSVTYLAVRSRFTTEVLDVNSLAQLVPQGEMGLQMAREMGWRSAETAVLSCLAQCLGSMGEYGRALELSKTAIEVAEEIQHREWICSASWALGHLYQELFALPEARRQLELALALAREIGSALYVQDVTATLASTYILQNDLDRAESILNAVLDSNNLEDTWGQRLCRCSRAELALARDDPAQALQIVDQLVNSAANIETHGRHAIPRLSFLRGQALASLGEMQEAEVEYQAARDVAFSQGRKPLSWHIHLALGKMQLAQRRSEAAHQEFSTARSIVEELAGNILDDVLQDNFLRNATALIPTAPVLPARQAAKKEYGGLTEREREVAALVALGKSNSEIAQELVVSNRTASTHVSNILNKLGFSSRAQIAAWAVDNGITRPHSD